MDARDMPPKGSDITVHNGALACRLRTAKLEALPSSLRTRQSQFAGMAILSAPRVTQGQMF